MGFTYRGLVTISSRDESDTITPQRSAIAGATNTLDIIAEIIPDGNKYLRLPLYNNCLNLHVDILTLQKH